MTQFATAQQLADRLGVEFTAAEEVRADNLLTIASGLVQGAAGQVIERVEDDELTIRGSRERALLLPERPVESVSSVTLNGTAISSDYWYVKDEELLVRRSSFAPWLGGEDCSPWAWGHEGVPLVIVYTHGYASIPGAIEAVVLEMVARVWTNPGSVVSERLGQFQATYALQRDPGGMLLTDAEKRAIRRAVGRGTRSIPVR